MKKYNEFLNESGSDSEDYTVDEKNAVLSLFNDALQSIGKLDFHTWEEKVKPDITFDKQKDEAKVYNLSVILNIGASKEDFDDIIKNSKKVIKNAELIKQWNKNSSGLFKLELRSDKMSSLTGGPTLYLVGKMSDLLEKEEVKNYLSSAKGINKYNI